MVDNISTLILTILGSVLIFVILSKPYFGVIATMISLPLLDLLPDIPYLSSIVIPIGGATLVGFLILRKKERNKKLINLNRVNIISLLLIVWIFASNPEATFLDTSRNWILTYIQLWILTWLTGELMTTPDKQYTFMWIFSTVSAFSAFFAIQQGQIDYSISESIRAAGISGSPNSAARYFVVSMLFFIFLSTKEENHLLRIFAVIGAVTTFVGVFFTLSRTGILLLIFALGIHLFLNARKRYIARTILIFIVGALTIWLLSDQIISILESIVPSIRGGTDTVGLRYDIWQGGWRMWLDNIFMGVGIGQFPERIAYYAPHLRYEYITAHNSYLSMLAETGIMGFFLFIMLIYVTFKNFLVYDKNVSGFSIVLRNIWLSVFLVILLGSLTKTDHYDKLLWFLFGMSVPFSGSGESNYQSNTNSELVMSSKRMI